MNTKWKKIYDDVELPTRAYPLDSGVDIKAYIHTYIHIRIYTAQLVTRASVWNMFHFTYT